MPKVAITQKNISFEIENNSNLMDSLIKAGLPVASSCHGEGVCSMCRVKIEGNVNPPKSFEVSVLMRNKCEPNERLSCQVLITSDLTITTKYW